MKRSRPLSPARTSDPIPSIKQVATALAIGAAGLTSAPAAASDKQPEPDQGSPEELLEKARRDAPRPASDTDKRAAIELYRAAEERFASGDFAGAQRAFLAAYVRAPNFRVLHPLAQVYAKRGNGAAALAIFEMYLADGGDEVPPDRRREVAARIAELRATLGTIAIEVAEKDVEIILDGRPIGRSPLSRPLMVSPGQHEILLIQGTNRSRRVAEVAPGSTMIVRFDAAPEVTHPPLGGVPPEPVHPHGMCACDVPGGPADGASLDVIAAAAAAIVAARRRRR